MANRVKVWKYLWGLIIKTNNFYLIVKVKLGLENTYLDGQGAKIGLSEPMFNRVKVWRYFYGLTIETNYFAFEVNVDFGLNYTFPGGWMGGWRKWK